MTERTYRIKEAFPTLQGEGSHTGRPAVFLRMAGCNQWSGREADRTRDAARNGNRCALFCDTDFFGGEPMTADQIRDVVHGLGASEMVPVVLTGGEPLLQLDAPLAAALRSLGCRLHVESNGTVPPAVNVDWLAISPKVAPELLRVRRCDELKVIVPAYDPRRYLGAIEATFLYVQPEDGPDGKLHVEQAVAFVRANPAWRLSLQTHKLIGLP